MLKRLLIKNFALIDELTVEFTGSLNVLTGETGAGKSIVIDAVALLLGGRAQSDYIRHGSEKSYIEGSFYLNEKHQVFEYLKEIGVDHEEGLIILTREISTEGKNVARINGRTLTLGQYRKAGLQIVDIHGQHDHQALLQVDHHLDILDKLGELEHSVLVQKFSNEYYEWQNIKKKLNAFSGKEEERLRNIDFFKYQLQEINRAKLQPGEEEELKKEASIHANAEKIANSLQNAYQNLYGGEASSPASEALGQAISSLEDALKYDDDIAVFIEKLQPTQYIIEEVSTEIRNYVENIEFSPQRLEQIEKRLQLISDLKKKYGNSIQEIIQYAIKAEAEIEILETSFEQTAELKRAEEIIYEKLTTKAQKLSKKRLELSIELERKVKEQLKELSMPDVDFKVKFTETSLSQSGSDSVEFLISPNKGEILMPVAKISSGGELSRIMLSIKTILADKDGIGTLIFDEIDSGVGGKSAQKLAEKLKRISCSQQVICVTHSAIIASVGDEHILVYKTETEGRTITKLKYLSDEERIEELTRMIGGENSTEELKKHASQMIMNRQD